MSNFVTISKKHGLEWEKEHAGLEVRWVIWAKVVCSSAGMPLCSKRERMNFRGKVTLLLQEYKDKPWNMDLYLLLQGDTPLTSLILAVLRAGPIDFDADYVTEKIAFFKADGIMLF